MTLKEFAEFFHKHEDKFNHAYALKNSQYIHPAVVIYDYMFNFLSKEDKDEIMKKPLFCHIENNSEVFLSFDPEKIARAMKSEMEVVLLIANGILYSEAYNKLYTKV